MQDKGSESGDQLCSEAVDKLSLVGSTAYGTAKLGTEQWVQQQLQEVRQAIEDADREIENVKKEMELVFLKIEDVSNKIYQEMDNLPKRQPALDENLTRLQKKKVDLIDYWEELRNTRKKLMESKDKRQKEKWDILNWMLELQRSMLLLPSDGKTRPVYQVALVNSPSSEDGQEEALQYVATNNNIYVSGNSTALEFLALLHEAFTQNEFSEEICAAAEYLQRPLLESGPGKFEGVGKNDRYLTRAFCDALNTILDDGISILHQGCIGPGAMHSGCSARCITTKSPTLMVGETKGDWEPEIRMDIRGQLFNEVMRHRLIDTKRNYGDSRPFLVLAFNKAYAALDLCFPSRRGGCMANSGWVEFNTTEGVDDDEEVFWTIQLAMLRLQDDDSVRMIQVLLYFLKRALGYLKDMEAIERVQFKTPYLYNPKDPKTSSFTSAQKHGDNVTILTNGTIGLAVDPEEWVYKEYCYYLRQSDGLNFINHAVQKKDQRLPPPEDLLLALSNRYEPYQSWKINSYPFNVQILEYKKIQGNHWPKSIKSWTDILAQVNIMHSLGYVHGDLLPRNLVFTDADDSRGYIIDFDLSRKENQHYVVGYNQYDFLQYRHEMAEACYKMKKEHDVHSLIEISKEYFYLSADEEKRLCSLKSSSIEKLETFFSGLAPLPSDETRLREETTHNISAAFLS